MEMPISTNRVELIVATKGSCYFSAEEVASMAQELLNLRTTTPSAAPPAPLVLDLSKPVQTRDGRRVTLLSTAGRGDYPIVGYIDGSSDIRTWCHVGTFFSGAKRACDLINVAETVEFMKWINVHKTPNGKPHIVMCDTREDADRASGYGYYRPRFACIELKVSATEGEGL